MSISFSGLTSGIDTSSWIDSLVQLRNAKVTKLEEEKSAVTTTQEALNNIKSYFSSFRSLIEKVTDTKFNISTTDLFTQNLATSSNASKLTATATSSAEESSYEVTVDKLASNTTATSGIKYTTTIVSTTTATKDTLLKDLSSEDNEFNTGIMEVTNNQGTVSTITLTSRDTIGSFINKLNSAGVEAYYNENSGVFSVNLDVNNIKDTTGTIKMLQLENVNSGYTSENLTYNKEETIYSNATSSTKLSELGANAGTITIKSNGAEQNVSITKNTTIGDFVQKLNSLGVSASFDDGLLEIDDIEIVDEGNTNIIDALGIETSTLGYTYKTDYLMYEDEHVATEDDTIYDFTNKTGNVKILSSAGNVLKTITVNESTTFGSLFEELEKYGIEGSLEDGVISFSSTNGNVISGDYNSAFGLTVQCTTIKNPITETITTMVTTTEPQQVTTAIAVINKGSIFTTTTVVLTGNETAVACSTNFYVGDTDRSRINVTKLQSIQDLDLKTASSGSYSICTTEDLKKLAELSQTSSLSGFTFVMGADIDLSDAGGIKIGNDTYAFSGRFIGNYYEISNFKSTQGGLFGRVDAGTIALLGLKNADVTGADDSKGAGILCDNASDSTITACYVINSQIKSDAGEGVGGLIGYIDDCATIQSSYVKNTNIVATDTADTGAAGGLVGNTLTARIESCFTEDIFVEGQYTGGLVGYSVNDTINQSAVYNATIQSSLTAGGLIGFSDSTNVNKSNAVNISLTSKFHSGGLIGFMNSGTIKSSYTQGGDILTNNTVSSSSTLSNVLSSGGLVGYAITATIVDSYSSDLDVCMNTNTKTMFNSETEIDSATGGLVGVLKSGTMDGCRANNSICIAGTYVNAAGGLVGALLSTDLLITSCVANATISDTVNAQTTQGLGLLVGEIFNAGNISNIYYCEAYGQMYKSGSQAISFGSSLFGSTRVYKVWSSNVGANGESNTALNIGSYTYNKLSKGTVLSPYGFDGGILSYQETTRDVVNTTTVEQTKTISITTTQTYSNSDTPTNLGTITQDTTVTRDTLLNKLGVSTGSFYIKNNKVTYAGAISASTTVGDFIDTLCQFGVGATLKTDNSGSYILAVTNGNVYFPTQNNTSNVIDLFSSVTKSDSYRSSIQTSTTENIAIQANENTSLSEFDTKLANGTTLTSQGTLVLSIDGNQSTINITDNETVGSFLDKMRALGLEATISNGQIVIEGKSQDFSIDEAKSTSNLITNLGLTYDKDMGGYAQSSSECKEVITEINQLTMSASATADLSTNLGFLNITDGTVSLYKNGEKKTINIDSSQSFGDLRAKIASAFSDVDLSMDNGFIKIYSKNGDDIEIGATNDTSNFTAIVGLQKSDQSTLESTRALYKVNDSTKLTENNVFKQGNIKEGTFTIGNEVFTIDNNTTVRDLVSMINGSEDAAATAYWDSINGQLVITSRNSGSSYINIENGTSNITDILGFTETDSNNNSILHIDNQTLGSNAKFTINGTNFTSNSNKITSDISRIKGVTIDLKSITEGETVTLTVERDKDQLADALSDIVNSYNDLITNVDSQIASTGELHDQTILKMLRNNLKSLMTGSDSGAVGYKTLDSIGICLEQASASNISTDNLSTLTFDKDKFISAYDNDKDSLKALLVGSSSNSGILTKVEDLIENSLKSVTGYFDQQNTSYKKKITTLENKITKENSAISTYRTQLEKKFSQMDTLIGKIQQQYSSFLSS